MSDFQGTPGPWEPDPFLGNWNILGPGEITLAEVFASSEAAIDIDTEANARLIAAAPELLEALQVLLPRCVRRHPDDGSRICMWCGSVNDVDDRIPVKHDDYCEVAAAYAAIAKALGQEATA